MQQRWNSFDVLKGLACIAVVFIHFNFDGNLGLIVKACCRFGVPVFFITSGFFFLSNGQVDDTKVASKIRHIARLILFSGVFYAVFTVVFNSISSENWDIIAYTTQTVTATKLVKFFITNDPFVYSHLWFLMGLLYCYIFMLLLFSKNKRLSYLKLLAPCLLIIYTCLQEFGSVLGIQRSIAITGMESRIYLFNLFLFRALPFFFFGILLRQYSQKITKIPLNKIAAVIIIMLGATISVLERFFIGETQFFVGTYLMLVAFFVIAIKHPNLNIKWLRYIGCELSLYIYIFHIAIGRIVDLLAREIGFKDTVVYAYGRAPSILILSLILAQIIFCCKKQYLSIQNHN